MEDFKKAPELVRSLIHQYYCEMNSTDTLNYYAKDMVSWIGIFDKLYADTYGELNDIFETERRNNRRCEILQESYRLAAYGTEYCVVTGCFTLAIRDQDKIERTQKRRATFVLAVRDGALKIVHQHMSVPQTAMGIGGEDVKHTSFDPQTLNQLQIEKERNDIVAELSDDIIFEYDFQLDTLEIFRTDSVTEKRVRSKKEHALHGIGLKGMAVHPDDLPELEDKLRQLYEHPCEKHIITAEFRKLEKEHGVMAYCWRRAHVRCICDMEGRPVKAVGKIVDIGAEKQLLRRSTLDSLTGLLNRAWLEQETIKYIKALPEKVRAAFILVDIDYFKKLNDTCGHLKGDEMLHTLAKLLQASCRSTDIVGRLGGDEFVILLKDIYDWKIVIERVKCLQESIKRCGEAKKIGFPVTLSIGITMVSDRKKEFKEMYHEADVALYQAKRGGRNQYVIYDE